MELIKLYDYWSFGTCVRYLQDLREGQAIHETGQAIQNFKRLFKELERLGLQVSIRAGHPLRAIQKEFEATPTTHKLTAAEANKLRTAIVNFRSTLEAELKGLSAYVVSPKRLDVTRLIANVPSLFTPGVFDALSDLAKYDLVEAGKCIAFERPTAVAFHLMRSTEEVLRSYYCHFVRRERIDPMMWFGMVQALQKHRKTKANDALHRNLDNIRISFRNPTQHPDKVYDIQEAQDLWGLCVDVIGRMQRAIIEAD